MNRETSSFRSSDTLVVVDRSRRRRMIFIAVGVLVIALAVAFFMFRGGEEATPAGGADGKGGAAAPTVTVAVPGRQAVDRTISATGTLAARRELPIGVAGEGGQVVRVLVEPGQWVGAGQVLAVIDRSVPWVPGETALERVVHEAREAMLQLALAGAPSPESRRFEQALTTSGPALWRICLRSPTLRVSATEQLATVTLVGVQHQDGQADCQEFPEESERPA